MEIKDNILIDVDSLDINEGTLILPSDIIGIADATFENNTILKKVVIPSTIEKIETKVFLGCINLEEVVLSENIKEIADQAFKDCVSLKKITFPDKLVKIGASAFQNAKKLNSIDMPEHLKVIETNAFWNCESLKKVTFNQELEELGDYAFGGTKLSQVEILSPIKNFGLTPFHMCYHLSSLKLEKLYHNQVVDETNSKLSEIFLGEEKIEIIKPIKKIVNYNNLIIVKYSDESFQVITKPLKYYDKKYFETTFPSFNMHFSTLMKQDAIFNIYYWETILENEKLENINPIAFIALPPNINTIKAYYNKSNFYNDIINKYDIDKFDAVFAIIKFITIFGGLCKKNINIEKYIEKIGIKNITKQFCNVNLREFNQKFVNIYLKLLDEYSNKEISEIMPFLYNNINLVSNLKDNVSIEEINNLKYDEVENNLVCDVKVIKSVNNSPNYEWLDTSNTVNLLWGFILGSVSSKNINVSEQERTVRNYNIKDSNNLIVASAHAYYSEDEKYLLFNSINLSQSFVTKGYDVETIKNKIIEYVLASIEDVLNFLNEKDAKVSKVHVGISEKNIKEQLLTRGTKVINQNI